MSFLRSSRSHCVLTFHVQNTLLDGTKRNGKLNFGDLAGNTVCSNHRSVFFQILYTKNPFNFIEDVKKSERLVQRVQE